MTTMDDSSLKEVEVLTFDVFGTVVDWHGSIMRAPKNEASESMVRVFSGTRWTIPRAGGGVLLLLSGSYHR